MGAVVAAVLAASTCVVVPAAAADAKPAPYAPRIRPADFGGPVDNPYFPLRPGTRWVYEADTPDGHERTTVEVTDQVKRIRGIDCVVVRDVVTVDGRLLEDTTDWYAQDRAGNVWYFGEATTEYEPGKKPRTKGSWEAGVRGAQPGIVMKADPAPGRRYRQEYLEGEAEDYGKVVAVDQVVETPVGTYEHAVKTRDTTPLEPDLLEHKYYAPGVGLVLEIENRSLRVPLVEHTVPA